MEPVKPDEMWCVWYSPQTGTFEWICGAKAANDLFHGGMTKINDKPVVHLQIVDVWPELKGVHVRATTEVINVTK
jgi:hypothetical protein